MRVYPHWWVDDIGSWEFDANSWKGDVSPVDIPDSLLDRYEKTQRAYIEACEEIRGFVDSAPRVPPGTEG